MSTPRDTALLMLHIAEHQLPGSQVTVAVRDIQALRDYLNARALSSRCHWANVPSDDGETTERFLVPGCDAARNSDDGSCNCDTLADRNAYLESLLVQARESLTELVADLQDGVA